MTRGRSFFLAAAIVAIPRPGGQAGAAGELKPVRVSEHAWYVQGDSGMASAANRGFNSNAGFVVTRDSVVVIDALGTPPSARPWWRRSAG